LTIKGAFSEDDLLDGDLRYFSQLVGNFKLSYGVDLNFSVGKVGDTSYLGDYVYSEESDFNSEISLGKASVEKQQFFDGDLSYTREKEQGRPLNEYYSLSGSYVSDISFKNLPGKLRFLANLNSSVNVNDHSSVSRPPSSAQVGVSYNQLSALGQIQFSNEMFGKLNSFVNSADSGSTNEEFSFQYGILTSVSAPSYKKVGSKVRFSNPRLSLSFNGQENDIKGNYFIGTDELSWGNIFSGKKIIGLTESEKGLSVSFGLDRQVFWETGQRLEVSFAASKIEDLTYTPIASFGLTSRKLSYLGKFYYKLKNGNSFSADGVFSSKAKLLKGNFKSKYIYNHIELGTDYEILDQAMDSRLSGNLETLKFTSKYSFLSDFQVKAGGRYDLIDKQMAKASFGFSLPLGSWEYNFNQEFLKEQSEKFSVSAIYDDKCTRLTFSFENRYQDLGSSDSVKSLIFRVRLKPFANVVFSQGGDQITF
jgi:hypothetical protein